MTITNNAMNTTANAAGTAVAAALGSRLTRGRVIANAATVSTAVISSELAVLTNGVASRWSRCSAASARASSHGKATARRANMVMPT